MKGRRAEKKNEGRRRRLTDRWREECFLFLGATRKCGTGFRDDKAGMCRAIECYMYIALGMCTHRLIHLNFWDTQRKLLLSAHSPRH